MEKFPEEPLPEWDLGQWEQALTIHVGSAYVCPVCGAQVALVRGQAGHLRLRCCHTDMRPAA